MTECTGTTATWCPTHGDCTCERHEHTGEVDFASGEGTCPLHSFKSDHAEEATMEGTPPPSDDGISVMDLTEFVEEGWLQEANRQFFHPHGLALEVARHPDGGYQLSRIWDYREDVEGIVFAPGGLSEEKRRHVNEERMRHAAHREALFNFPLDVQPIDWDPGR